MIKPRAGLPESRLAQLLEKHGGKIRGRIQGIGVRIIDVPPQAEEALAKVLAKNPQIKFAEKDFLVEPIGTIPNDPQYDNAWHLPKISAPSAWDWSHGDGVTVAVLDTGVDINHSDLAGEVVPGWNAVSQNTDIADVHGHGTAVAGTVAAATDNANGVSSVAWNANIMPVRITNRSDGWAYWSDIANGLIWAADHGAKVANISYGVSNSSTVSSAAQHMISQGGVVVVAAGNDGSDPGYSDNPYLISVSATDGGDNKASWSNYGDFIDISAPGVSILTTNRGGGYGKWSGTSFASPVTAGVAALIMAANPNLTPDEVEAILEQTAFDPVTGQDWHAYYGFGRVNAFAAVSAAYEEPAPGDTQAPAVSIFSPDAGATVSDLVAVEVSASDDHGVTEVTLYANGQLVDTDTTAPYQFSWDSTQEQDGGATLTAYAYDAAGNEGISAEVQVTVENTVADTTAPSVSITTPSAGSVVSGLVSVEAGASDDHGVTEVTLYANGQLVDTDTTAPYQFSWDSTQEQDGGATLTAYAYDAAGNEGISAEVQVTVENSPATNDADTIAPTVRILSPSDGSTVRHKVQIWVSARDDVSLASIQLSIDGQQVSSSASRNLVYEWNTRPESDGGHIIEAVAEDASGNVSRQIVQVTVKNSNGRWK
ncbi:MAG: Ig-like domain-containing protein [Methylohalobius sp. ZOD2]